MLTEEMTMTYEESVKYLYKIAGFATKSSLEDIKYFLERLGNPQKELHMIHVAGTNGKGSVCAFLVSTPYPAWKEDSFLYLATCCEDQ
jgi:folC: bifunctional protein FolC